MNAVANAWLDGDKVLVTSTNNGAVNVAVARTAKDVSVGLLIRTGNRDERVAVPGRITAASEQASEHRGNPAAARAGLKRAATERAQLMEKLARLGRTGCGTLVCRRGARGPSAQLETGGSNTLDGRNPS